MKQSRLDELMKKENISNEELLEVVGAMFVSMSKHFNEIKNKLNDTNEKLNYIEDNIGKSIQNIPIFNVISEMDEEEPDD